MSVQCIYSFSSFYFVELKHTHTHTLTANVAYAQIRTQTLTQLNEARHRFSTACELKCTTRVKSLHARHTHTHMHTRHQRRPHSLTQTHTPKDASDDDQIIAAAAAAACLDNIIFHEKNQLYYKRWFLHSSWAIFIFRESQNFAFNLTVPVRHCVFNLLIAVSTPLAICWTALFWP